MIYYKKITGAMETIVSKVLIVLLLFAVVVGAMQVFTRVVLKSPLSWTEEAARFSFVYLSFLGAFVGYRRSSHFNMDFLIGKMQGSILKLFNVICDSIVLIISLLVVKNGYGMILLTMAQRSPILKLKMSWVYGVVPVAFFMIALHAIERLYDHMTEIESGRGGIKV